MEKAIEPQMSESGRYADTTSKLSTYCPPSRQGCLRGRRVVISDLLIDSGSPSFREVIL